MGFDAEWALAGCMKRGSYGSGFPRGWMSEKHPCPECAKPVAGRHEGMTNHLKAKHGMKHSDAILTALRALAELDEYKARNPERPPYDPAAEPSEDACALAYALWWPESATSRTEKIRRARNAEHRPELNRLARTFDRIAATGVIIERPPTREEQVAAAMAAAGVTGDRARLTAELERVGILKGDKA